jgi:hydrogenase nickel incorporation protein HypB
MCTTCGCGQGETRMEDTRGHEHAHEHVHADGTVHAHPHDHSDPHGHGHDHGHHDHGHDDLHYGRGLAGSHAPGLSQARMVQIEQDILGTNDTLAAANRKRFAERGIFAVNLVSSPGSGKTTLLVKTIEAMKGRRDIVVIEGDQESSFDADRIRATGAPALQINTGKGCHLDADMVGKAVERLAPPAGSVLMIENVGNLVCPAGFDLGEAHKVVVLSVTEGEDKPLKYPDMFRRSSVMLLNKVDLLPYVEFDVAKCIEYARRVNPDIRVIEVSATKGQGMSEWFGWIEYGAQTAAAAPAESVDALKARLAELEAQVAALKSLLP